ncbi:MAG: hypothetical protein G8345_14805 [Magnetococcales bacterium]|nr:hypothetical protein [Magnetococcales bacterium]NGZ28147.1 hypothetical protein [Magnetococcales bacterium]
MIRHIVEPARLYLAWQAPDGTSHGRTRRKVAEIFTQTNGPTILRYLKDSPDYQAAFQAGFSGYPAFGLEKEVHDSGILETFLHRLPPQKRRDYKDFLRIWRLNPEVPLSPMALLGYAGAQLPGDGFSLVHPFDTGRPPFEILEEVAGFRHLPHAAELLGSLQVGQQVYLRAEPDNPYDPFAIRMELANQQLLGYVNRLQAPALHRWLQRPGINGLIDRINGTPSRPLIYVFLEVGKEFQVES